MSVLLLRLVILALVMLLSAAIVWTGRAFVERQRRLALTAAPLDTATIDHVALDQSREKVRILAFSSADCTQCHTQQLPALRRLQAERGDEIDVIEIDAPASPELVKRYHVLTVPSTVILSKDGAAHAINYGFANLGKLQQQVSELMVAAY